MTSNIKKYNCQHPWRLHFRFDDWKNQDLTLKKTHKWDSSVAENVFLAAPKTHQDYWNLPENNISYNINKYGFRSDEFPEKECRESITFIGCSNTFGIGIPKEHTWTSILAKELNLKEINLAVPGGSLDSAFRVYNEWQPIHKSKITCLLMPPENRMEIMWQKLWHSIGPWSFNNPTLSDELVYSLLDDNLAQVNIDRNLAAIKYIAQETDSKILILRTTDFPHIGFGNKFSKARDQAHPGFIPHMNIANHFLERLKE